MGRGKGPGKRPEGGETVVDDVEGLGLVAEMMLAPSRGRGIGWLTLFWGAGRLIGASVVDVGGLGVA
jgi:hypothetical protein